MQSTATSAGAIIERAAQLLEYSTKGGATLGPGLQEIDTSLRVDFGKNEIFLERHQPTSDAGGEPLGTFRTALPADLGAHLRDVLAATDLRAVPAGSQGGPGTSLITIRSTRGADTSSAEFSSRDVAIIDRLESLLSVLNDLVGAAGAHPFQAIGLKVVHRPIADGGGFEIRLTNVGTEVVAVPNLGALGASGTGEESHGLGVRVAEYPPERPGYTAPPLHWSTLRIVPSAIGAPSISLAPGATLRALTTPWPTAKHGMRHLVQAMYAFYGEPVVVNGHLMMRGRALSEALEVTP